MAAITLSGLDEKFVLRIKKQAAVNNRTLEDEIRHILEQAVGLDPEEMAARQKAFLASIKQLQAQQQRERTTNRPQTTAEALIREDRDNDHGRL